MKTITYSASGLISSLLLAAGFDRAAEKLDPLNAAGIHNSEKPAARMATPCQPPCCIVDGPLAA